MIICPVCSSSDNATFILVNNYQYHSCNDCRAVFLDSIDPQEQIKKHLSVKYKKARIEVEGHHVAHNRWLAEYILRIKSGGRSLDVGCGSGRFVKAMHDNGFDASGVDLGAENKNFARDNLGVTVLNKDFLNMTGGYDVITLHQLIEHVPNPSEFIARAQSMLSHDGVLVISTPNLAFARKLAGLPRPILGDALGHPPNHCILFEPNTIRRIIENNGFKVIAIRNNPTGLQTNSKIRHLADLVFNFTNFIGPNMIITAVSSK
jgi:2-polyprenyl-3-methyl-5-hydroxy-6-metoxy-1,4-benzoquinol methylase